ncbi:hypothetical protein NECAME_09358 [Necator americanus]|uniref:Uncharacterized protein n=1 Tax=Necator americanus TaxID=51031 RepID=W2TE91_NECAM|nr:hypothetical protein NECAME_09358 [Necator americanus]ETN80158.1 hypothetical protein NECAME_09358 [Necator americanus]
MAHMANQQKSESTADFGRRKSKLLCKGMDSWLRNEKAMMELKKETERVWLTDLSPYRINRIIHKGKL